MLVLSIETSCDETAAALLRCRSAKGAFEFEVLSNIIASQIEIHRKWGGVYPELASRAHLEAMMPTLEKALEPLGKNQSWPQKVGKINALAVTAGPGLIGSLLMGVETAQILGAYFGKPTVPVNHLEGHIYAAFASQSQTSKSKRGADKCEKISQADTRCNMKFAVAKDNIFPALALIVSGGHTSLILMKGHLSYKVVGETIDDAAGEAFDKVARILRLGYPGGPAIEELAKRGRGDAYRLPLAMTQKDNLDFSFSGLKTAALYLTKNPATGQPRRFVKSDLAASFQKTVAEILIRKTLRAVKKFSPKVAIFSGGVSANEYLRRRFADAMSSTPSAIRPAILIPPKALSTDNALGIAVAGAIKYHQGKRGKQWGWAEITADSSLEL